MKFQINGITLKKTLKYFANITYNNNYKVEMNGILFEIYKDKIIIEARNSFLSIKYIINQNIKILKEGIFLIKAKLLNEVISKLENENVTLNILENNLLIINTKNSHYEINLMDYKKFTKENFITDNNYQELNINNFYFKKLIESVVFAGDEKSNRKILQGINIKIKENEIKLVASDNIRIAYNKQKVKYNDPNEINKIIPIRNIKEYLKLIIESQDLKLQFFENKMLIITELSFIQISLIEGVYPNFEAVFPKKDNYLLTIKKDLMLNLLDRALPLVLNKESSDNIINLNIKNKNLIVESKESEIGFSKIETQDFNFKGENDFSINFNPKLLKEAIMKTEKDNLNINFDSSDRPFVMQEINSEKEFRCLILPFKI